MSRRFFKNEINRGAVASRSKVLLGCLAVLASAGLCCGQTPELASPARSAAVSARKVVPLVSDACPTVQAGSRISLDWYPGFDLEGAVTGIRAFTLSFSPVLQNGATPGRHSMVYAGGRAIEATPTGNGYYHVEFSLPRNAGAGAYTLVDAHAAASTTPDYEGDPLMMTNSPVDGRFCINVTPYSRPAPQASASN